MRSAPLVLLLLLLGGCSAERTEVVVRIVAGDAQVLDQIDHLALFIRDVDAGEQRYQVPSTALCGTSAPKGCITLPVDLTLFPGPQRPMDTVEVEAQGLAGDQTRIDTAARFQFVTNNSGSLTIALHSACLDRTPACAGSAAAPYCEADGSCGQPGMSGEDAGAPSDLSTPDLESVDLTTRLDAADGAEADSAVAPDLLTPDLAPCAAPPGVDAYVDAVLGVDDLNHGSGDGACAFRTVTYGLTHARADTIFHLAPNQIISADETFPLVLAGQTLACGANTILNGSGPPAAPGQFTVELSAAGSAVRGCTLTPQLSDPGCSTVPATSYTGAHVTGSGTTLQPITIDSCVITNSQISIGIYIESSLQGVSITNNVIKAVNDVQVGLNVSAQVLDNTLQAGCGGTTFDVRCVSGDSVGIVGNNGSGTLTCNGSCYATSPPVGQQCP